jgi:outer membrane receptor protein involved in Fe transport
VTVTATRSETRIGEVPASVVVLERAALDVTAAPTIDDALRQVVGFSLFRRTGSRAANPTVQGVSLRGLGASGASRALVLMDGLPLYESDWRVGLQARWMGDAWEDDGNSPILESALVLDLFVARRLTAGTEAFVAAENLLDADVVVGRTPVRTLGAPRLVRAGLRFHVGP